MFWKRLSILLLSLGFVLLAQLAFAGEPLRIGWVNAMANTPLLIAEQMGYFKENDLDVELRRFNSGPLIMRAIEAGDLDVAYIGMPPVYHAAAEGTKLKIIAKVNYGQAALLAGKKSGIKNLAELKGKKIAGVRKGSGMDVLLRGFILKEQAGLDHKKDVEIIHMRTNMMDASLDHRVVHAAFSWEPFVSQAVLAGHADILLDVNKVIPNYPWYVIAASDSTLRKKHSQIKKLLITHLQAVRYLNSNPSAGNELIKDVFRLGHIAHYTGRSLTADKVVKQARTRLGWQAEFMDKDKEFLQKLMDYSYELSYIDEKLNADDILDLSIMKEAIQVLH